MLHVLAGQVVKLVEVLRVRADHHLAVAVLHRHDSLEHCPGAILYELAERVQVCGIDDGSRVDTLAVLALGLSVELLPPFSEILELRIEGNEHLNALSAF